MTDLSLDIWPAAATRRRLALVLLIALPTAGAVDWLVRAEGFNGSPVEIALVCLFGVLFAWTLLGFWTALLGFVALLRGARYSIASLLKGAPPTLPPGARTAIVMPICNEDAQRVFAGLGAIYRSIARTQQLARFEFFVLSDTPDAGGWIEEEEAWDTLCRELGRPDAIHYRRRRIRLKRKSGNIADFLRRHGRRFRYMIVLDADSIMAGSTMVDLVRIMERRPRLGILQTLPVAIGRTSLIARAQQFAQRVYGPLFAAGINHWQLGDTQYWGHNAIIRVAPFMHHCLLPRLPGRPPLGGEVLSHDFVEAALMRRAGYEVWLTPELGGSFEETPPSLLDELKRDRRWCQGNLQHLRLLAVDGLHPLHRVLFLNGALAYAASLLWLLLIVLGSVEAVANTSGLASGPALLPLFAATMAMLFVPKFLGAFLVLYGRRTATFAGIRAFLMSILAETLLSALLAPIRMLFYSRFVLATLLGRTVQWRGQQRDDYGVAWRDAIVRHAGGMLGAAAFGLALLHAAPAYCAWLAPVLVPLLLAAPVSVWTSRATLGRRARSLGLFVVPEERRPPRELIWMWRALAQQRAVRAAYDPLLTDPCLRALLHPRTNALHLSMLPQRQSTVRAFKRGAILRRKLQEKGIASLSPSERAQLLSDPLSVAHLHEALWSAENLALGEPTNSESLVQTAQSA